MSNALGKLDRPNSYIGRSVTRPNAKRLLAVADKHLPRPEHLQIAGNPDVEGPHVETQGHVVRDDGLQVGDKAQRMNRHADRFRALFPDHRHLVDHRANCRIGP